MLPEKDFTNKDLYKYHDNEKSRLYKAGFFISCRSLLSSKGIKASNVHSGDE
jgi:hypothetical protein